MFETVKQRIENYKSGKKFNAENCLNKQVRIEQQELNRKIDEIKNRINYVSESTTTEHAVIYQVHDYEQKMFDEVKNYFENLGFTVINLTIPELGNDEYMIISWKK
jgi:hypothetical protein